MIREFRRPLLVFQALAFAAVVVSLLVHAVGPTRWVLALNVVAVAHWLSHVWFVRSLPQRAIERTMILLCAGQFVTAVLLTVLEPWLLHLTPLVCLSPVIVATGSVDGRIHRRLAVAAIAVIFGIAIAGRLLGGAGPVALESSEMTRSLVAVAFTPVLAGFVGWTAWRNQRTMLGHAARVAESRERLTRADERARARFERTTSALRVQLGELRGAVGAEPLTDGRIRLLNRRTQATVGEVRELASGLGASDFSLTAPHDVEDLERALGVPVVVEVGSAPRPRIVDDVVRDALLEVADRTGQIDRVHLRREGPTLIIDVIASYDSVVRSVTPETLDRIEALGGWATTDPVGHRGVRFTVGTEPLSELRRAPRRQDLRGDLRLGFVFPVVALAVAVVLSLTALRDRDMYLATLLLAALYVLPCGLAVAGARRAPRASLMVFVISNWTTAIVITDQLNIVKWFGPIALLTPVLLLLPYIGRLLYTVIGIGTFAVTAAMIAIARFGSQIAAAQEAPGLVTDVTVVLLVPLTSAVVLVLAQRNHEVLADATAAAQESRRRLVEAHDQAKRSIERDLHDGTQQRLVSAALQLQVAARKPEGERAANLALAASELEEAERSLAGLIAGAVPAALVDADLAAALASLAAASPVPIRLRIDTDSHLDVRVSSSLWFCCSEAITNAVKHAGPGVEVVVDIRDAGAAVHFRVADDGVGFSTSPRVGSGLVNIRERCAQGGGSVEIRSRPGHGTVVSGMLPVEPGRTDSW